MGDPEAKPKSGQKYFENFIEIQNLYLSRRKVLFELFYLEFYLHFYLHFESTVISDYDRSRINIFNNKNVTKSKKHELVLDSDNQLLFMLPSEMDGHGRDFGNEFLSESVSEADSGTRFL